MSLSIHEKEKRGKKISKILAELYPDPPIPLEHEDAFTLLVAVLLSAQCTDIRVNQVSKILFAKAKTPTKMLKLGVEKIRDIIRPCGLSERKSQNIYDLSRILLEHYDGQVPQTAEELEALPGVGEKTAAVVLMQAFNIPSFPVDTHILRLANRWGLSESSNPSIVSRELKQIFPKSSWAKLHLQIIFFGREHCKARSHDGNKCPICRHFSS